MSVGMHEVIRRPGESVETHILQDVSGGGSADWAAVPIIKGSGVIKHISLMTTINTEAKYLKLYNKATLVTHATDEPDWMFYVNDNDDEPREIDFPEDDAVVAGTAVALGRFSGGLQIIVVANHAAADSGNKGGNNGVVLVIDPDEPT